MKPCRISGAPLLCLVLAAIVPGYAASAEPAAPAEAAAPIVSAAPAAPPISIAPPAHAAPRRELAIVVVDSIHKNPEDVGNYGRVVRVFTDVFRQIRWPLKVQADRLVANTPDHDTELRIFLMDSGYHNYEEFTFRAWITLYDHGKKHDFGIIGYTYHPHRGQAMDDMLDMTVRGVALITANKIAPILFSKPPAPKS